MGHGQMAPSRSRRTRIAILRLLVAAAALAGQGRTALALEGYPASWCRGGMFSRPLGQEAELRAGRIEGQGPAFVLRDADGCPAAGTACRHTLPLRPGTSVAILDPPPGAPEGYACVQEPGTNGLAGWVPREQVQALPSVPDPKPWDWAGNWHGLGDDRISLRPDGQGLLTVRGHAYWPGRNIPPEHTGALSGTARPVGDSVTFGPGSPAFPDTSESCQVRLVLLSPTLLAVNDNMRCGGANVSFSAIYARVHPQ